MALFKCPDCKTNISTEAGKCPHCGIPVTEEDSMPKPKKRAPWKVIVICAIVCMVIAAAGWNTAEIKHAWTYCSLKHCETWNILDYIIQPAYAVDIEEVRNEFRIRLDDLDYDKDQLSARLHEIADVDYRDAVAEQIKNFEDRESELESAVSHGNLHTPSGAPVMAAPRA